MKEIIEHTGIVKYVNEESVGVKILQSSACAACKAKAYCSSNEKREVLVEVDKIPGAEEVTVGQQVTVCASTSTGRTAIIYAFVLPFIVMIAVLVAILFYTGSEQMSAVAGILSLVVYYIVLNLNKSRLHKKISFWIK